MIRYHCSRYWNSNGVGIAIVAVHNEGIDWAAYIGADDGISQQNCTMEAATNGEKLREADARFYFPQFKDVPYRY